jgi:hypothetical protein
MLLHLLQVEEELLQVVHPSRMCGSCRTHYCTCCCFLLCAVDCVATCEVDLSDIWRGASGDISSSELLLVPSPEKAAQYTSAGVTGQLRVTFIAARALATLRHYIFSG